MAIGISRKQRSLKQNVEKELRVVNTTLEMGPDFTYEDVTRQHDDVSYTNARDTYRRYEITPDRVIRRNDARSRSTGETVFNAEELKAYGYDLERWYKLCVAFS